MEINGAQFEPLAVVQVLRPYLVLPPERVRVFASSSRADLDEQVQRENRDLRASSLTASQFLQKLGFSAPAGERDGLVGENAEQSGEAQTLDACLGWQLLQRRTEREQGADGDHDLPYRFSLPTWTPQAVAWARFVTKVQSDAIQP